MNLSSVISTHIPNMPVGEFIAIETCERQRDTAKHALKAKREHLKHYSPAQRHVSIAQLPDGKRYKLDGHTRAYLWERGDLEMFDATVSATIYHITSKDEAKEMRGHFDAPDAARRLQ